MKQHIPDNMEETGAQPATVYQERRDNASKQVYRLERIDRLLFWPRVLLFIAILFCIGLWLKDYVIGAVLTIMTVTAFVATLYYHKRVDAKLRHHNKLITLYEEGLARINHEWHGHGPDGAIFQPTEHNYASQLDLFGHASLFQLMCSATTTPGQERLARWMVETVHPTVYNERQQAVRELAPALKLREQLAMLADHTGDTLNPGFLKEWASNDSPFARFNPSLLTLAGFGPPTLLVISIITWLLKLNGPILPAVLACFVLLLRRYFSQPVYRVLEPVRGASRGLKTLSHLLHLLQQHPVQASSLMQLQTGITTANGKQNAAREITRLEQQVLWLEAQLNQVFAIPAIFLMWDFNWALRLEKWRLRNNANVQTWLHNAAEFEAFLSVARFAYEHSGYTYPDISENQHPFIQAAEMGHPLVPNCVTNPIDLGTNDRLHIVSGSNMSGKSTYLKTLGVNLVLAQLGAPVFAQSMTFSPMKVVASLDVHESLEHGVSRFYAEVLQLKRLIHAINQQTPVLYLIDEIFHGTNSHDRRVGARALVAELTQHHAIGLITSHDLELTQLANDFQTVITNHHFEDQVQNGNLHFDYRIKPGVVRTSNALQIMREAGLPV